MTHAIRRGARLLSAALILGGVPPMLSGLIAMFAADSYLQLIGSGVNALFPGPLHGLLHGTWNLQGGDAFVAGSARVAVALLGSLALKRILAWIGIAHSLYELWVLPTVFIAFCQHTPAAACGAVFYVGVSFFIALHVALVIGFASGLWLSRNERGR